MSQERPVAKQVEQVIHGEPGTPSENVHVLVQIGHNGHVYVRVGGDRVWPMEPVIGELTVFAAATVPKRS